jgi:histidinol-phosphate aminotransferase
VGAVESLRHPDETERRRRETAEGRAHLEARFALLGLEYVPSQANFVYVHLPGDNPAGEFLRHAVIIRPFRDGWVRVTVGTGDENERFLDVLPQVLAQEGGHPGASPPEFLQPDG